jgi:hypothetical protein
MSKYPFRSKKNLFNSTDSLENEEDHMSFQSLDNLNQKESSKVKTDNLESEFNFITLNRLFGGKKNSEFNKPVTKFILKKSKRGRKTTKNSKKETHSADSYDNILRKIQTHFLNFMISFINDCIKSLHENKKMNLKNINYEEKKKIKRAYLEKIKYVTINEIINNIDISTKYKKYNKDINRTNLTKLSQISFFKKLFQMKFIELFCLYYNESKPLDKLFLFDKTITLSKKTKPYYNLLKDKNSNEKYFIEITKMNYINDFNKAETDNNIGDCSEENICQRETNNSINIKDDEIF